MTVEDPIEYYIDGIGQTQVNTKVEMTFARGLRAILRQDPDVVMVGEIRDLETAQIAVQASLDRPPRAVDAAHEHRRRRGHATARHGHRAVPAVVEPGRRARAAPGARAESGDARGLHRRRVRARGCSNLPDDAPSPTLYRPSRATHDGLYAAAPASTNSSLVDEHMRTMIHDGASEHRPRAATRAPARRASATTAEPRCLPA